MKYQTIIFTYTGEIAKNYGVDGSAIVKAGLEYTPDNIKDDKIASIWVQEGFAKYKTNDDATKPKEIKYEDVSKKELEKEEKEEAIEEVQSKVEEAQKQVAKKRGRPSKK